MSYIIYAHMFFLTLFFGRPLILLFSTLSLFSRMIDDGVPICETTEAPTMSPTLSIDRFLKATDAPTVDEAPPLKSEEVTSPNETGSSKSPRGLLSSLFKASEHQAAVETENSVLDEATGNRILLSMSDEDEYAMLKNFDPISISDNLNMPGEALLQSLARGEVPSQAVSVDVPESMCPTYGPSVVPRRLEDIAPDRLSIRSSNVTTSTSHLTPGRSRHTQHQLVQYDAAGILNAQSIVGFSTADEAKKRRIQVAYGDEIDDLRIVFVTSSLADRVHYLGQHFSDMELYNPTRARVTAYVELVFPAVSQMWSEALKIRPLLQNIVPHVATCGETSISEDHLTNGVADADVVIYVELGNETTCSKNAMPTINICHFDQNMRPLVGSVTLCLDEMDVQDDKIHDKETHKHIAIMSQLMGRFLGLSPSLFNFFSNPETGKSWGERKLSVSCEGGDSKQSILLSNLIEEQVDHHGIPYYQISSPTVKRVVQNHFDCQTLGGARLSAPLPHPDKRNECTFFNLDLRYHFDEDMTSIAQNQDAAYAISPLSLALLEDSSWYKANFRAATTPTFGRGAGCGFVEDDCITKGKIPDYSVGYFCSSHEALGARSGCDHTHYNKAGCDLSLDANPPENFQYFHPENPEFGSQHSDVDYCPMRSKHLISCSSDKVTSTLIGESFEENSRCYETDAGIPICLETTCNPIEKTLSFLVQGKTFHCSYHGQVINVGSGYSVVCPRIAAVCPDLVCPSNCSGKGTCDYCKEVPECICDNPFDQTDGCFES